MIDWVAFGSIGTVAAALIGWLQYRKSRVDVATGGDIAHHDVPIIDYTVIRGSGSHQFPKELILSPLDENWMLQRQLIDSIGNVNFTFLTLRNNNKVIARRVVVMIEVSDCWSFRVEETSTLSKSAIDLVLVAEGIKINVAEMPVNEVVKISIFTRRAVYVSLLPANAAVKFSRRP